MVNEDSLALLSRLKEQTSPVSGATLAREWGLSRVAVWKRFEALRQAGYRVTADRAGYRLLPSDKPLPWEFPGDEEHTFHFETLESTMDEALRLGLSGLPEAAVVAEHQTQGRGREQRSWLSPGGDLLVTLVLRPVLPLALVGALALEALTSLAETLDELYGLALAVKWPNDLLSGDSKVAGVLVEAVGPSDRPRFYTVGLGLNVHSRPSLDRPVASVEALGRPQADRRAILARWRRRLRQWSAQPELTPKRWARVAQRTPLVVETFDGRVERGSFLGFDRSGGLLLEGSDPIHPIRYGEARRATGVAR